MFGIATRYPCCSTPAALDGYRGLSPVCPSPICPRDPPPLSLKGPTAARGAQSVEVAASVVPAPTTPARSHCGRPTLASWVTAEDALQNVAVNAVCDSDRPPPDTRPFSTDGRSPLKSGPGWLRGSAAARAQIRASDWRARPPGIGRVPVALLTCRSKKQGPPQAVRQRCCPTCPCE